jgi:hypothetical protein
MKTSARILKNIGQAVNRGLFYRHIPDNGTFLFPKL